MERERHGLVVESSVYLAKPATMVWQVVRRLSGLTPEAVLEAATPRTSDRLARATLDRSAKHLEVNDERMLLRMEMSAAGNVAWSSGETRLRIESADTECTRVTLTCLAITQGEPMLVHDTLRSVLTSTLDALREKLERTVGGAARLADA